VTPYYSDDSVTIYHGDALCWVGGFERDPLGDAADVMVTDPPYGINYKSGHAGHLPRSITNDQNTHVRDAVLDDWGGRPALVFGTWKAARPRHARMVLIWDTKGALGMGDLSLPWKPAHQEIYVIGRGFSGPRTSDVLCFAPVQAKAENGRVHPHEKPVDLLSELISKCPPGSIIDPFMGSGSTLVAAKLHGRKAIGIEIDERYCEIAARRMGQEVLDFGGAA